MKFVLVLIIVVLFSACTSAVAPAPAPNPPSLLFPTLAPAPTITEEPTTVPTSPSPETTTPLEIAASLCANAFYPTRPDAEWEYSVASPDGGSSTYTKEIVDATGNSFTEHRTYTDTTADHPWSCTAEGLVSNYFANLHIHGLTQYHFNTTRASGITLPPSERWNVGQTWTNSYDVNGEINENGYTTSGSGVVNLQNTITARETVTVPAGTFETYRVDTDMTVRLNASAGLFSIPVTLNVTQSAWYAQDTGLVRSTLKLQSDTATVELASYSP